MLTQDAYEVLKEPTKFHQLFWPGSVLADYQIDILKSIQRNKVTVVVAGNKLGKDYIAALASLWFFCSRSPARVITTSVDGSQLEGVLWGEIRNFLQTSTLPLPVQKNHLMLRQIMPDGSLKGNSEMIGRVVAKGEGLLGRHLPFGPDMEPAVLAVIDEASGFDDDNYMGVDTWAHRILIIGNAFPCENFFKRYVEEGDVPSDSPYLDYEVKVFEIPALMSPNIRLSLAEERLGKEPSRKIIVPGCLDIDDYRARRKSYDAQKASASLDAKFYKGAEVKMFPEEWLELSHNVKPVRQGRRTMGIDTAEGGDNTVWTVIDQAGIIAQISKKTKNTAVIKGQTIGLMRRHNVHPEDVIFDAGGGGKEHADYLREDGYQVRTVGFGQSPLSPDEYEPFRKDPEDQRDLKSEKYAYVNLRVQMYDNLSSMVNPDTPFPSGSFHIPRKYAELIRQLEPLPVQYNGEGRMYLPPKDKPHPKYKGVTIKKMLGCSPDESDSLVLAAYAQVYTPTIHEIGAM